VNGLGQGIDYLGTGFSQFPEGALRQVLVALLGFTLLWSGFAKVRSPAMTADAMANFGVVTHPSFRLAWGLAIGELVLALSLLIAPAMSSMFLVVSAGLAGSLFLGFSVLIARTLRMDRRFDCACFGSGGEELSRKSLTRASLLALMAWACALAGSSGPALVIGDLVLVWCGAGALLGTLVLFMRSRELVPMSRALLEVVS